jgi:hypothetical protein
VVSEPVRGWRDGVTARFNELVRLPSGWDGYNGLPVSFVNANFTLRMLEAVCDAKAPGPQVVPGKDGDLQIEWHTISADVEIHVLAPNQVVAWRQQVGRDDEELRLSNDFTVVTRWISELVEPARASGAAAA